MSQSHARCLRRRQRTTVTAPQMKPLRMVWLILLLVVVVVAMRLLRELPRGQRHRAPVVGQP